MTRIIARVFLRSLVAGLLLSGCTSGVGSTTYVPRMRDLKEEAISGDYWYQRFTLYTPANSGMDCQISRTGRRIDLNSPAEVAEVWRQFCRTTSDHDSRSDSQ